MKNRNSSAATGPMRPGSPIDATEAVATEEPFSDLPVEWFERAGPPLDNCPTSIYTEREEYTAGQLSTEENMKLDAPFIKSVSERRHNHVVACKGRILEPEVHRYNCYIPHLAIVGISDQVVPDYCATIQGIELTTVQGDHSQVNQPIDEQDTRYKVWRNAVQNALTSLHASQKVPIGKILTAWQKHSS